MYANSFYQPYWENVRELEHYGVKGMKWGVRKEEPHARKNRKKNSKSTYRRKLEAEFRKKGMTSQEAELAADKRIRMQKIIAGVAAVSVASIVAYKAYNKYADEFIDKTLKEGTKFQTIDAKKASIFKGGKYVPDLNERGGRYYASYGLRDTLTYKGLHGKTLLENISNTGVISISSHNTKDFKIPSRSKAASIFGQLYEEDSTFKEAVEKALQKSKPTTATFAQKRVLKSGVKALTSTNGKKIQADGYNAFNVLLASNPKLGEKFYTKLKENGYNALIDLNDKKYSGYKAKNPLIVFDMDSVIQDTIKYIGNEELNRAFAAQDVMRHGSLYLSQAGIYTAAIGALGSAQMKQQQKVQQKKSK